MIQEGRKGREDDTIEAYNYTVPLQGDVANRDCLVPGKDGKTISRKGMVVDSEAFEKMKDEYYEIRGWDISTGLQTKKKLEELDLADVAERLASRGMLV